MISGAEWIWVIIAVVVIFGASRLPLLGRNLGQGIKEFKKGVKEAGRSDGEDQAKGEDKQITANGSKDRAAPKATEPSTPDTIAERRD